jgi:hypothetical protein
MSENIRITEHDLSILFALRRPLKWILDYRRIMGLSILFALRREPMTE